jgi:hypothetical protein
MSHRLNDLGDVQNLARLQEESKYLRLRSAPHYAEGLVDPIFDLKKKINCF